MKKENILEVVIEKFTRDKVHKFFTKSTNKINSEFKKKFLFVWFFKRTGKKSKFKNYTKKT